MQFRLSLPGWLDLKEDLRVTNEANSVAAKQALNGAGTADGRYLPNSMWTEDDWNQKQFYLHKHSMDLSLDQDEAQDANDFHIAYRYVLLQTLLWISFSNYVLHVLLLLLLILCLLFCSNDLNKSFFTIVGNHEYYSGEELSRYLDSTFENYNDTMDTMDTTESALGGLLATASFYGAAKRNASAMIRKNNQVATACLTSGLTTSSVGR